MLSTHRVHWCPGLFRVGFGLLPRMMGVGVIFFKAEKYMACTGVLGALSGL